MSETTQTNEWKPATDQQCCGTCRHLETLETDDGYGPALQCSVLAAEEGKAAGVARWWGSACTWFARAEIA
jgi:hypothetical protein